MDHIRQAMSVLSAVIKSKPSHVGEKKLCLKSDGAGVRFEAYSPTCDVFVRIDTTGEADFDEFEVYFNAEKALKVFELAGEDSLFIEIDNSKIVLIGSDYRAELEIDYSLPSYIERIRKKIHPSLHLIDRESILRAIDAEHAIGGENSRFKTLSLEMRLNQDGREFRGIATNGHLLSINGDRLSEFGELFCLNRGSIEPLRRIMSGFKQDLRLFSDESALYVEGSHVRLAVSLGEINKIVYSSIIPLNECAVLSVDKSILVNAIENAAIFINPKNDSFDSVTLRSESLLLKLHAADDFGRIDKDIGILDYELTQEYSIVFNDLRLAISNLHSGIAELKFYSSGRLVIETSSTYSLMVAKLH